MPAPRHRLSTALVTLTAAVVTLLAPLAAPSGAVDHHRAASGVRPGPHRVPGGLDEKPPRLAPTGQRFLGSDGHLHESAPQVVGGLRDDLFLGLEFDYYCALGREFDKGLRRLGKLAHMIEASGRTVVWTAAPNKSLVLTRRLRMHQLPQGGCDRRGIRHQTKVMDTFDDDLFLPLRKALAQDGRQVYWRTDHHWTSVGGSVFAEQLAARLSPRLAAAQRFRPSTLTMLGVLNAMLQIWVPETAEAAVPANGVHVRTVPGSTDWAGMPSVVFDHAWTAGPAARTWHGNTLVLGDSFTMHALQDLRPMFAHGRFMWIGHVEQAAMAAAIRDADTVVLEVYQTGVVPSEIGQKSFRRQVRHALRGARG